MSEATFQKQVLELAARYDWEVLHILPGATKKGVWRSPIQGSLGVGWPDLFLARAKDQRIIAAELKDEDGKATPEQMRVLGFLSGLGFEWHIWKPRDLPHIAVVLR
jgi:hypothetical protein